MFVVDNCHWFYLLQRQLKLITSGHTAVAEGGHQLSQETYANMGFLEQLGFSFPS